MSPGSHQNQTPTVDLHDHRIFLLWGPNCVGNVSDSDKKNKQINKSLPNNKIYSTNPTHVHFLKDFTPVSPTHKMNSSLSFIIQ